MTPAEWIGAGIGAAGLAITAAGWFISHGRQAQRLDNLEKARGEDRDHLSVTVSDMIKRLETAEATASAVTGLVQAVENLGEKWGAEIKHLAEIVGVQLGHMREQMDDLKVEVKRRAPRPRAPTKTKGG